jgi:long-chain-fatty-acid--CoA ligase ACSBG
MEAQKVLSISQLGY